MKDKAGAEPEFQEPPGLADFDDALPEDVEDADTADPEQDQGPMPESEIERVKMKHEQRLLAVDGVVGVGIGSTEIGDDAIVVYLREAHIQARIPSDLDGFPVRTEISGEIDAY